MPEPAPFPLIFRAVQSHSTHNKYNLMQFVRREGQQLTLQNLFNAEHAEELIKTLEPGFTAVAFHNVGIKIMKLILTYFEELPLTHVTVLYNWNEIMVNPKLVCYDKSQWKTLQQLSNWNREWKQLFSSCFYLTSLQLKIECSWMDSQFVQQLLQGAANVPNIQAVAVELSSKNKEVGQVLSAFDKAKIFGKYEHRFSELK